MACRDRFLFTYTVVIIAGFASSFSGCFPKDNLECDLNDALKRGTPRKEVEQNVIVLRNDKGRWVPESLLKYRKLENREIVPLEADGHIELYGKSHDSPILKTFSAGPVLLEYGANELIPEPQSDENKDAQHPTSAKKSAIDASALRDVALNGARFALRLPDTSQLGEKVRYVKWIMGGGSGYSTAAIDARNKIEVDLQTLPVSDLSGSASTRQTLAGPKYLIPEGLWSSVPIEAVYWSGDPRYRFNIVILPDGYTHDQLPLYQERVKSLVDEVIHYHSPFNDYRDLINIIRVDVASQESGASCDDDKFSIRKNRYGSMFPVACFNAVAKTSYNDRFLYQFDARQVEADTYSILFNGVSIADTAIVLVNSDKYGGSGITWATISNKAPISSMVHEMGHTIGHLAEEYLVEGDICHWETANAPNVSLAVKSRDDLKWKDWVLPGTPIPTPDEEEFSRQVGMFQGAGGGCKTEFYRPVHECRMSSHFAGFCPICKEQMILKLFDRLSPIEGDLRRIGDQVMASVAMGERMRTRWYVDGQLVQDTQGYKPLIGLRGGNHEVRMVVSDEQAPVKRDRCNLVFARSLKF